MLSELSKPEHAAMIEAAKSPSETIRVLVLFGAIPLYGQERATLRLFQAVRDLGVKAKFLINGDYGDLVVQPELDRLGFAHASAPYGPLIGAEISLRQYWRIARGIVGTNWALWREMRHFRPTHLFVMNPLYVLYTSPLIFLSRLPLVYRIGDAPPVHSRTHRIFWTLLGRRTDFLVTNADYVTRLCREAGSPAKKLRRIYSAVQGAAAKAAGYVRLSISHYEQPHRHVEVVLRRDPKCLTVVFVGQLLPSKGFHLAIAAAESLISSGRPLRLLLAGDYSYRRPEALAAKERIEREGLGDRIQFLGYVNNVADLMSIVDLHLCPSLWDEPLSNTVLEAKSAGVPSVIFPRGGLPETSRHGTDGWICQQQTAEGLEEALRFYLDHPGERSRHAKAARESATGHGQFGWDRSANEWLSVFKDSAASIRSRRQTA